MKFVAPEGVGAVTLSSGSYLVVNGLIDVPHLTPADENALSSFGFEVYTGTEEGSFRRSAADAGSAGKSDAPANQHTYQPDTGKALEADGPADAVPVFDDKRAALDYALEVFGADLDGRRSLKWLNQEIARLAAEQG